MAGPGPEHLPYTAGDLVEAELAFSICHEPAARKATLPHSLLRRPAGPDDAFSWEKCRDLTLERAQVGTRDSTRSPPRVWTWPHGPVKCTRSGRHVPRAHAVPPFVYPQALRHRKEEALLRAARDGA